MLIFDAALTNVSGADWREGKCQEEEEGGAQVSAKNRKVSSLLFWDPGVTKTLAT